MKVLNIFQIILVCIHIVIAPIGFYSCKKNAKQTEIQPYLPKTSDVVISRDAYKDKLYGFWLGQCIANWTGLVTEMDKIGNIGEIKTGDFYTREDWGHPDQPSIWAQGVPSNLSATIEFVFMDQDTIWGADDDTDIEYMYQHLLSTHKTGMLSADEIRNGWIKHIKKQEENFLWVSNQRAFDLMNEGMRPPATGEPRNNKEYEMIDAQLTTEIFGLYAPSRADVALSIAYLPVRTTASENAVYISEFYITMHALASSVREQLSMKEQIFWMSNQSRKILPNDSYSADMYDYVLKKYNEGQTWEQTRDSVYIRYQVNQQGGYNLTSKNMYCNACFAAGINFAASLVSLFYGEGDIKETIKIAVLAGWDSDNPASTWGGLLGFMIGKSGVEQAFGRQFSDRYNIHRTRQNFPNNGIDNFDNMSKIGIHIIDRIVQEQMKGGIDLSKNVWYIPMQEKE